MAYDKFDYLNFLQQNQLKESQRFHPLFEAMENAFNAIEERIREGVGPKSGEVTIVVHRDMQQATLDAKKDVSQPPEPLGFTVSDDGVGFRTQNWQAFTEVYTTYKKSFGGKGVRRLSYLLAFGKARVNSSYAENDKHYCRTFTIERCREGTTAENLAEVERNGHLTKVHLSEFDFRLRKRAPKSLHAIAKQIVTHFFKRFSVKSNIACKVIDEWNGVSLDLEKFCREEFLISRKRVPIRVGSYPLTVTHTKCRASVVDKHQIMLCANGRVVSIYDVPASRMAIKNRLHTNSEAYFYVGMVEGELLDARNTDNRLGFSLNEHDEPDLLPGTDEDDEPSIARILDTVGKAAKKFLKGDIDPLEAAHRQRIIEYCTSHVVFRPLLRQKMDELMQIPLGLPEADFEKSVWRIYYRWKEDIRDRFKAMTKSVRDHNDAWEKYRDSYRHALRELNQLALYELASYVTDRKAVIDFLWDRLSVNPNGRFTDEAALHDIFFPRNATTDDIAWDESNLWLIDERLVFQQYAASDKSLRGQGLAGSTSNDRPDIASHYDRVFDETYAFTEGDQPFCATTLIEFKRPERTNYSETENPHAQVTRYIREIRSHGEFTKDGHTFRIAPTARFTCMSSATLLMK